MVTDSVGIWAECHRLGYKNSISISMHQSIHTAAFSNILTGGNAICHIITCVMQVMLALHIHESTGESKDTSVL